MAKKTFVLDTNVLLSDPSAIFGFDDNNVIIPLMVLEELDHHKTRSDEVGRNARETTRKIGALVDGKSNLNKGIALPGGGLLRMLSVSDVRGDATPLEMPAELSKPSGDNSILELCMELQTVESTDVVLVSRDLLMRLKALTVDVPAEDYNRVASEDGASKLYTGATELEGDFDIEAFYKDGEVFLEPEETANLSPNQFLVLKNGSTSALARYDSKKKAAILVKQTQVGKIATRNKEQTFALDLLNDQEIKLVTLAGFAGCGKTLLAIAAGLEQVLAKKYKTLVICRPIQSVGNEIGFLPGTIEEKMEPWIAPIKDNLRFLLGNGKRARQVEETLAMLFEEGTIEIQAMTYIRGRSIAGAYMVIDEAQNLNMHELKTIITRVGEGTKIVLTGDIEQIDNQKVDSLSNGLTVAIEKFKDQPIAGHVTLMKGERSELATLAAKLL